MTLTLVNRILHFSFTTFKLNQRPLKAIGFYLTKSFVYALSILPFRAIYIISSLAYPILWYVVKYRKAVTMANLHHAFPDKTDEEINAIAKRFYRYFCDNTLETLKLYTMTQKQILKRVSVEKQDVFEKYHKDHQSVVLMMAHYGNWEWEGQRLCMGFDHSFCGIYKPLSNKRFDQLIYKMRGKFGAILYESKRVFRNMLTDHKLLTMSGFIGDQKPISPNPHWVTFLNQDTPVFRGAFTIAKKLNYPIIYAQMQPVRRGYYHLSFKLLADDPNAHTELELAELYFKELESNINAHPEYWLWTHRRWRSRTENEKDIYISDQGIKRPDKAGDGIAI
jgi:KDO2-lipid IV(A) lauroyltransferase